jgi:hypothetical protein
MNGQFNGCAARTRTPNPRIKRPKFTYSQYDHLRLHGSAGIARCATRAVRGSSCWTRTWTPGPLWTMYDGQRSIRRTGLRAP